MLPVTQQEALVLFPTPKSTLQTPFIDTINTLEAASRFVDQEGPVMTRLSLPLHYNTPKTDQTNLRVLSSLPIQSYSPCSSVSE
jgi:hypothetical protein